MSDLDTRASYARAALTEYVRLHGSSGRMQFDIVDLVSDLLHLACHERLHPRQVLEAAALHMEAEIAAEGDCTGSEPQGRNAVVGP